MRSDPLERQRESGYSIRKHVSTGTYGAYNNWEIASPDAYTDSRNSTMEFDRRYRSK